MNAVNMRRVEQKGDLASTTVEDVLRSIEELRESARVWFKTDIGVGQVAFSDGFVVRAEVGLLRGRSALLRLLGINEGQYSIEAAPIPMGQPLVPDVSSAVQVMADRQKQWRQLCEATPPMSSVLRLTASGREFKKRATRADRVVYSLLDGHRSLMDVLSQAGGDPIEALRIVVQGVELGHFTELSGTPSLFPLSAEESGEVPKIPLSPDVPRIALDTGPVQPVLAARSSAPPMTTNQLEIRRGTLAGLGADFSSSVPPPRGHADSIETAPIISVSGEGAPERASNEADGFRSVRADRIASIDSPRSSYRDLTASSNPPSEPADSLIASAAPQPGDVPAHPAGGAKYVGRYHVIHRIGRGGMGSVYLALLTTEGGFRRLFALKLLRSYLASDGEATNAFLAEARLAGHLHHPNVVSVVDAGIHRGQPFLVMDYVEGCSFKQLLSAHPNNRPERLIVPIILDALEGLHAVHTLPAEDGTPLEVVHCDVSPENLLVGSDGVCRLTDLGVARRTRIDRGQSTHGKPSYVAPEQVTRGTIDRRVDIFAMGVVLWTALTGERLFQGATIDETLQRVCNQPIPPPSRAGLRPDPALDEICLKALARDPNQRYPTAEAMHTALREVAVQRNLLGPTSETAAWVRATVGQELSQRRLLVLEATRDRDAVDVAEGPVLDGEAGEGSEGQYLRHAESADATGTLRLGQPRNSSGRVMLIASTILAAGVVVACILWPAVLARVFRLNIPTAPATAASIRVELTQPTEAGQMRTNKPEPIVTPVVPSGSVSNQRPPKSATRVGTEGP